MSYLARFVSADEVFDKVMNGGDVHVVLPDEGMAYSAADATICDLICDLTDDNKKVALIEFVKDGE